MTAQTLSRSAGDQHRPETGCYRLSLATQHEEVVAAQRLRYHVFAGEYGAITPGPVGLDVDDFDEHCDHLLVWFRPEPGAVEQVVATYRLLAPRSAAAGLYTATEFDVSSIAALLPFTVETGRTCVHPEHRNGTTMGLLWGGMARYMLGGGHRYLLGCASVSVADGGVRAAGVWGKWLSRQGPAEWHCPPRRPWRFDGPISPTVSMPSLLKGYLRLGAVVLGAPAHDPEFNTADFPIMLDVQEIDPRYLLHFLGTDTPPSRSGLPRDHR